MHRPRTLATLLTLATTFACGSNVTFDPGGEQSCEALGLTDCDGACVDLLADEGHCGACGVACDGEETCLGGTCAPPPCPPEQANCGGVCVKLATDPAFCGSCAVACAPGEICSKGQCVGEEACPPGTVDCAGACVDTSTDQQNCGACGIPCALDETCVGGFCVGPPVVCPEASLGSGLPVFVTGSTAGKPDRLFPTCAPTSSGEATYSYTAPIDGLYTFHTASSSFDTVLEVKDSTCTGPTLACNDDDGMSQTSLVTLPLAAGQTVVVVVDGSSEGPYVLQIDAQAGVSCGEVALPSVVPQTIPGDTSGATDDALGACVSGGGMAPDDTYLFVAPFAATYVFDTSGSPFDTVLYARSGGCNGVELACDDDGGAGLNSLIAVPMSAGQAIFVFVDGFGTSSGPYTLSVSAM